MPKKPTTYHAQQVLNALQRHRRAHQAMVDHQNKQMAQARLNGLPRPRATAKPILPEELQERAAVMLVTTSTMSHQQTQLVQKLVGQGKIVLEVHRAMVGKTRLFAHFEEAEGQPKATAMQAIKAGLQMMMPSVLYSPAGVFTVHSDEDRVMMSLLERAD